MNRGARNYKRRGCLNIFPSSFNSSVFFLWKKRNRFLFQAEVSLAIVAVYAACSMLIMGFLQKKPYRPEIEKGENEMRICNSAEIAITIIRKRRKSFQGDLEPSAI